MLKSVTPASLTALLALLISAGCSPQTAELTDANYYAFMSEATSFSLLKGSVDPEKWTDCITENGLVAAEIKEKDVIDALGASLKKSDGNCAYVVDCRDFGTKKENDVLKIADALNVCKDWSDRDGDGHPAPEVEAWMGQGGFHALTEPLAPWRGEAILTAENDLQISFHHRLPGGADFRFSIVVDPDFQPTECAVEGDGAKPQPIDGDWLGNWTEDLRALGKGDLKPGHAILEDQIEKGTLWYLNARGFQLDPADPEDTFWSLPEQYLAGFAAGKFADEDFHTRAPRWGEPFVYDAVENDLGVSITASDLWFTYMDLGEDPSQNQDHLDNIEQVQALADTIEAEWSAVGVDYAPMVHANLWRTPDGFPSGLDGWVGLHYNYVAITGKIAEGEAITGAFNLILDGDDSNSRWFLSGKFDVPKIKSDKWTTEDLRAIKLEESGNKLCVEN